MFVYTGARPLRVILGEPVSVPTPLQTMARSAFDWGFFRRQNFSSFPRFGDPCWRDDDYLPLFFNTTFHDSNVDTRFLQGGGQFGGGGSSGGWDVTSDQPASGVQDSGFSVQSGGQS